MPVGRQDLTGPRNHGRHRFPTATARVFAPQLYTQIPVHSKFARSRKAHLNIFALAAGSIIRFPERQSVSNSDQALSRRDSMGIARRFNAGMDAELDKVPQGRQNGPHIPRHLELALWD